jgi:hypothetical protein
MPAPKRLKVVLLFLTGLIISCNPPSDGSYKERVQDARFIHKSVKKVTDLIVYDIFSPPVASRIYAYSSIAGYEAMIPQDPSYRSMAGQLKGLEKLPAPEAGKEYCYPLASVEAMLKVGKALVFSDAEMDTFNLKILQEFQSAGVPDDVFERSIAFGDAVAAHVLAWSSKDNYKQTRSFPKYSIERGPATWKPTPPAYMDAVEPHWNKIRCFAIDSATQFMPDPPTNFSLQTGSQFYREAMEVYQTGKNISPEQRAIASFWDCNPFVMNVKGHVMFASKKISPGGHWMNIARVICEMKRADPLKSAETYLLVSVSLVDGFISCWDEKYRSRVVRPETYINEHIDENWIPILQTPPFPEYTSGHSVISSSASVAMTRLFGNEVAFVDSTETEFGLPVRSFKSFKDAAAEAGISRLYGGIHYRPAVDNGLKQGTAVGEFIAGKIKTRVE